MKKIFVRIIVFMGIIALFSSFFACSRKDDVQQTTINFSSMSQEERKNYVNSYLVEKYNMNCSISNINVRQLSALENENNYYCIATFNDFWFSVWITGRDAQIIDTSYTYQLKDDVNNYIENLLLQNGISCVAYDRFTINQIEKKQWKKHEIQDMLLSNNIDNNIHLYGVDKNYNLVSISNALKGIKGAVYIHFSEIDYEKIDFDNYDNFIDLS